MRKFAGSVVVFCVALLVGCVNMDLASIAKEEPRFDFSDYFEGHTKASGWFTDRFGNVKRHFCGDFYGKFENQEFVLDETLYYNDGLIESRQWRVTSASDGGMVARSPSLVGDAVGSIKGNTLYLEYVMNVDIAKDKQWKLSMKDWMIYQPDGSLHNIAMVHKWGVRIGAVNTQYVKHEGELLCRQP